MSNATLECYIRQLLEAQPLSEIFLNWQGGEPTLMGLPFFERTVVLVEKYKQPQQTIIHTLQTNGTRLTKNWAQFLKQHHFLVGISLDGPEKIHNYFRVDKQGGETFRRVMQGLEHLKTHGVDFNILCTVNSHNVQYPEELYTFFRDTIQAPFIQFIPIVEKNPDLVIQLDDPEISPQSVPSEAYGKFLSTIFDLWIQHDVGQIFIQDFEVALSNWLHLTPSLCVFSETCGQALALEHNGDLYCCDHFVTPEYRLGNIHQQHLKEMIASPKQIQFGNNKRDSLPQYCLGCQFNFTCHGGCPKDRILKAPTGEMGLNYLCSGYQSFFEHISPVMTTLANLVRLGYSASEIMQHPLVKNPQT